MKKGKFSKKAPLRKHAKCMVFPDKEKDNPNKGSRFFYGKIVDIFQDIITVEVTDSTWNDYKKGCQLWFPVHQIWAEESKQLTLF
jgi:hypothetical protein